MLAAAGTPLALAAAGAIPAAAVEPTCELRAAGPVEEALPPLPPTSELPVQLVLDDDTLEAAFGIQGGGFARQFLWFNRFASPGGPFRLTEVWVLFPSGAEVPVGATIQIVVYHDPDSDPTNGADLLAAFDDTIQAADNNVFSIYPIDSPILVPGGGDVLIGVVPRYLGSGMTPPTAPASLDLTATAGRSWFGVWSGDPPDPPELPTDFLMAVIDDFTPPAAGNWMIRGFGVPPSVVEIPALAPAALAALAVLLALAGAVALRRRQEALPAERPVSGPSQHPQR
jgi:hypothetical protein